jgi:hypothetical protein
LQSMEGGETTDSTLHRRVTLKQSAKGEVYYDISVVLSVDTTNEDIVAQVKDLDTRMKAYIAATPTDSDDGESFGPRTSGL